MRAVGEIPSSNNLRLQNLPCGLTLSSSAPAFLVVMSSSEVYQGTWPGKAVVRWSEPWIRNLEAGIRNLEAGTRNPEAGIRNLEPGTWNLEEVEQQCSRHLGRVSLRKNSNGIRRPGAILPWRGVSSRVNHGSGEKKLFLAPRVFLCTGDPCSALRNDRRKETRCLVYSPVSIVDKLGDPALRILPYGYGPVYVIGALVAAGEIGR
ncbi:hypothetical protein F2Q69_00023087 [Brassica cretica]|uniref:Uncharacterized protein n=1 Tax=Brassica cretica TaxID=69181 RepID=A0A8S9QQI8_BRACR|nr:hypothetical protein F2Q69_00023087 [Brassica cretica]